MLGPNKSSLNAINDYIGDVDTVVVPVKTFILSGLMSEYQVCVCLSPLFCADAAALQAGLACIPCLSLCSLVQAVTAVPHNSTRIDCHAVQFCKSSAKLLSMV